MIKIVTGFDVHRLVAGRQLVLGGVNIDYALGLEGHSDADVLCHAVADALLGAVADGDIGTHFPDSESKWKDISSLNILSRVMERLKARHALVIHIDSTILAEEPLLSPYRDKMRLNIAQALYVKKECISVKMTTLEGLGALGHKEGIAAMAVATVEEIGK